MNNVFELTGKNVVLTGGAGFLGEYFVKALLEAGASVCVVDAKEYTGEALSVVTDVTDKDSVEQGMAEAVQKLGGLDVLVNNVAIDPKFDPSAQTNTQLFENYPLEQFQQSISVNLLGYVLPTQLAVRHMKEQGSGNIINVSSIYGVVPPHQDLYPQGTQKPADYGMTKAAIQYLTKYVAATYGKDGVRANALVFGGVLKGHDQDFQDAYGKYSMFGRMTDPEEVGAPMVFLASNASRGMTGHLMAVDGGFSAW